MSLCWDHQSYITLNQNKTKKKSKEKYQFRIKQQSRHAIEKQKVQTWYLNYINLVYIHIVYENT